MAIEQARAFIERAEGLGEVPEDPLLLFSVLYGFWAASYVAYNHDHSDLAAHFLTLAEKQGATAPLLIGHRIMGHSLFYSGDFVRACVQYEQGIALYNPAEHGPLSTRFGADTRVAILSFRSWCRWILGYPTAALRDLDKAIENARETGQAASLMFVLYHAPIIRTLCGDYAVAAASTLELRALAEEKGAVLWKASGIINQGDALAATGRFSEAIEMLTAGIAATRSTGATLFMSFFLTNLACVYSEFGQFDNAWQTISEALATVQANKERWCEAEVCRAAGETVLRSAEPDATKAQVYFERALSVAREQQAKSWELRAAMSLARLWRSQGKPQRARDLLAPVYSWFTEGFDTLDLKEAKALLEQLA
jgi:predicted ATPase